MDDDDDYEAIDEALIYIPPYFAPDGPDAEGAAPNLSVPIGLKQVLMAMGLDPTKVAMQTLRRQIQAKESLTQNKILVQGTVGGKYTTTLGALRRYMPELFVDAEISTMAKLLEALNDEIAELKERDELLMEEITTLKNRIDNSYPLQTASNGLNISP